MRYANSKKFVCAVAVIMLVSAFCGSLKAYAHSYKKGSVSIGHIWSPPTDGDFDGTVNVYGPLYNTGETEDKLLSVTSPVSDQITFSEGSAITLPMGMPVSLASWGVHIVLHDLEQPFAEGDRFPLTLIFEQAGSVDIEVDVEKEGAAH